MVVEMINASLAVKITLVHYCSSINFNLINIYKTVCDKVLLLIYILWKIYNSDTNTFNMSKVNLKVTFKRMQ
jgi:site-specific DNA-adenine methylase